MNDVNQLLEAWKNAANTSNFYAEFERLTGFSEADVKKHFGDWNKLRHETAEQIAEDCGVTIREGGFQGYLAIIKRNGRPHLRAIIDSGYFEDEDPNPRQGRPWPSSEDCKGCDGRDGAQYQHRFGCTRYGAKAGSLTLPVRETEAGKYESGYPLDRKP